MKKFIVAFLTLSFCPIAFAGAFDNVRVRAREHFEIHRYEFGELGKSETYRGLTNTINILYERPFEYSIGLALGPVIGDARSDSPSAVLPQAGEKIELAVAGLEAKYFPISGRKGFVRVGVAWHSLKTNGTYGDVTGWGYYGGLGWEIPMKWVSIAPEIAFRQVHLENDITGRIFTPSIGLHFYKELRN